MKEIQLNVNELNSIIAKHFGCSSCSSVNVDVASFKNQLNPKEIQLGAGSILNVTFSLSQKIEEPKKWYQFRRKK